MKRCPKCQASYDDNARFCRSDGAALELVPWERPEARARREHLEQQIGRAPTEVQLRIEFAEFLISIEQQAEALVQLYRAKDLGCTLPAMLRLMGLAHFQLGEYARCIGPFREFLEVETSDREASHCYVQACLATGDEAGLRPFLARWGVSAAGCDALESMLGDARTQRSASLLAEAARALAAGRPESVLAWRMLGRAEAAQGNTADAEEAFRALKGIAPGDGEACLFLAVTSHDRMLAGAGDGREGDVGQLLANARADSRGLDAQQLFLLHLYTISVQMRSGQPVDFAEVDAIYRGPVSVTLQEHQGRLFAECAIHVSRLTSDTQFKERLLTDAAERAPALGNAALREYYQESAQAALAAKDFDKAERLAEAGRIRYADVGGFSELLRAISVRRRRKARRQFAVGIVAALLLVGAGALFYFGRQTLSVTILNGSHILQRFGTDVDPTFAKQATTIYSLLFLGPYVIRVEEPGFEKVEKEVWITIGRGSVDVSIDLVPLCGTLKVSTEVPGAKVFVDTQEVGVTPLVWEKCPAKGGNTVVWVSDAKEGFAAIPVVIEPSKENDLGVVKLTKSGITLNSEPPGLTVTATLFGDDRAVPIGVTPFTHAGLPLREMLLSIDEGGMLWNKLVTSQRGQITDLGTVVCDKLVGFAGSQAMHMVWCPPGKFLMGSPQGTDGWSKDEQQHEATVGQGFWIGKFEVTQSQWQSVMQSLPSGFDRGPSLPVDNVSWNDCQRFIAKLNSMVSAGKFSLPTEVQWEYACRAGSRTRYCFGDDPSLLGDYAWYSKNSGQDLHNVGLKKPNAWGIHDMHGNVAEWCEELCRNYPGTPGVYIGGYKSDDTAIIRGGHAVSLEYYVRSADRSSEIKSNANYAASRLGLRLVWVPGSGASKSASSPPSTVASVPKNSESSTLGAAVVIADLLNIRTMPNKESESLEKLPNGTSVTVVAAPAEHAPWVRVRTSSGITGWVRSDFLSFSGGTPVAATPPASGQTEADENSKSVIRALIERWDSASTRKDLPMRMACYAEVLSPYYGKQSAGRELAEADTRKAYDKFSTLETKISSMHIYSTGTDKMAAEFDKEFVGLSQTPGGNYSCSVRQRLDFSRVSGAWQISGERELKVYWYDKGQGRVAGN